MLRIAKALYQSRKAWVGGLTILVTAVFAVWIGPALGLDADQSAAIATAIVAAGVAVIAGIAVEDHGAKSAGGGGAAAALLLLCLAGLAATAGGCMAPAAVREGQAAEAVAWRGYVNNVGRINDLTLSLYEVERTAAIVAATQDALRKVQAAAVDGKLPVAQFTGALEALVSERENAAAQTRAVVTKVRTLIGKNNVELAKALKLHGAVTEWLEAGIDESAIPGLIEEAMAIFQTFSKSGNPNPEPAPAGP